MTSDHRADRQRLQQLLMGQLPSAEVERLSADYSDDGRLQELAESLADTGDTLVDSLRNAQTQVDPDAERLVERLLERLNLARPASTDTAAINLSDSLSQPGSPIPASRPLPERFE